jgi:hypothetical protein
MTKRIQIRTNALLKSADKTMSLNEALLFRLPFVVAKGFGSDEGTNVAKVSEAQAGFVLQVNTFCDLQQLTIRCFQFILHRIPRGLLRGFRALAKSVPEGAKFRNTPSACGGDRNFEDFASLLVT